MNNHDGVRFDYEHDYLGARIASSTAAPAVPRVAIRFEDDSPWLVFGAGVDAELILDATQCRLPNTPVWFHGLINLRGQIAPVFDLSGWLGTTPTTARRPILIGKGDDAAAVLCAGEPRIFLLGRANPVGDEVPERLRRHVDGVFSTDDGPAYAFDFRRWFADAGHRRDADHADIDRPVAASVAASLA